VADMIRDFTRALVIVLGFLLVVAEVDRMDNEVTTDWSINETQAQ
jgi:hypothetical protein